MEHQYEKDVNGMQNIKSMDQSKESGSVDPTPVNPVDDSPEDPETMSHMTIYIAIGAAVFLLLALGAIVYCRCRKMKNDTPIAEQTPSSSGNLYNPSVNQDHSMSGEETLLGGGR